MHKKKIISAGKKITEANKALIMVHGRGGSAEDILSLAAHLNIPGFALLAPQATNSSWYPLSFLARPADNEPLLSSAINVLHETVNEIQSNGITKEHIYFLGFSQGACLSLEFAARNPQRYAAVVGFSGGLIGPPGTPRTYPDSLAGVPLPPPSNSTQPRPLPFKAWSDRSRRNSR